LVDAHPHPISFPPVMMLRALADVRKLIGHIQKNGGS
jgi:hypothetical protein